MPKGNEREASATLLDAVMAKRRGEELSDTSIRSVVADFTAGRVPSYQMAAWLATVACSGMTKRETVSLTQAYVESGLQLNLRDFGRPVVDKHSTGGVGDKTTLFVAPVVAACGVAVGKVTGRGLGFAGGTVDKLESFTGLRTQLSVDEFRSVIRDVGMAVTGQSDELVPGDRATYKLRDVTATVDSIPLIAASVMSKKIAAGTQGVVLDVKFGVGAVLPDLQDARALAILMVDIGDACGLTCRAVLSDMSQPLGYAIGNALEVKEAIRALSGEDVPGYTVLCRTLSRLMLQAADGQLTDDQAYAAVDDAVASGAALRQFRRWVAAQGGDPRQVDNPELLPTASHQIPVRSQHKGWVEDVDARILGEAAIRLGAGRLLQDEQIDHSSGIVLERRVGDQVQRGDVLAVVHWNGAGDLDEVERQIHKAFHVSDVAAPHRQVLEEVL